MQTASIVASQLSVHALELDARSVDTSERSNSRENDGSATDLICQACGFDTSYAPQGQMLTCEACRAVYYCSSNCRDWDLWSNGHATVCQPITTASHTTPLELSHSSLSEASSNTQPSIDANQIFVNASNYSATSETVKDFTKGPSNASISSAIETKDSTEKRRLPKSAKAPSGQLGSFLDHHGPKDVSKLAPHQFGFALPSHFRVNNEDDEDEEDMDDDDDDTTEDEESLALSYIQNSSQDFLQSIQEESGETAEGPVDEASWRRKSAYTANTNAPPNNYLSPSDSRSDLSEEQRQQEDDDHAYLNSPIHRLCHESTSSLTGNLDTREHGTLIHLVDSTSCFSNSCNMSDLNGFEEGGGSSSGGLVSVEEECEAALSSVRNELSESEALVLEQEYEPSSIEDAPALKQTTRQSFSSHRDSEDPTTGDDESIHAALNGTSFSTTSTEPPSPAAELSLGKFSYLKRFRDSYNTASESPSPVRADRAMQVVKQHFGTVDVVPVSSDPTPVPPEPPSGDGTPDIQRLSSLRDFRNLYYSQGDETADMLSHHSDVSNSSHDTVSVQLLDHLVSLATAATGMEDTSLHSVPQGSSTSTLDKESKTDSLNTSATEESEKLRMARMRHQTLKNSLNSALRVYEEVHGQDAAKDIFLQLTGSLTSSAANEFSVDTQHSSTESQGSESNALGSIRNDEATEGSLSMGQDTTEISEVSTHGCMVHPRDEASNLSTAARYFQYRNSLQSSAANLNSSTSIAMNELQPCSALLLPKDDVDESDSTPGRVDSDVDSDDTSVVQEDTYDSSDITSTIATAKNVLRYMQYREKLGASHSSVNKLDASGDTVPNTPEEDEASVRSNQEKEVAAEVLEITALHILATLSNVVSEVPHVPLKRYSQYRTQLAKYDSKLLRPAPPLAPTNAPPKTNAERIIYGVNDSLRNRTNAPEFLDMWNELESDRADIETDLSAARSSSKLPPIHTPGWSLPAVGAAGIDVESGQVTTGASPQRGSALELEPGHDEELSYRKHPDRTEMVRYGLLAFLLIGLPLFVGMCVVLSEAVKKEP